MIDVLAQAGLAGRPSDVTKTKRSNGEGRFQSAEDGHWVKLPPAIIIDFFLPIPSLSYGWVTFQSAEYIQRTTIHLDVN